MTDEETIKWCQDLIDNAKDGAKWVIPRSRTVFKINKKLKRLVFISGLDEEFEETKKWFGKIGYSVIKE